MSGGGVKFVQQDIRGSTRCVTSLTGNVLARMDFQAFGEQIPNNIGQRTAIGFSNADSIRHRYALTENDTATGLNDTWWRKLENRSGRWTSPDPYNGSMSLGDPQSFNRNSYVQNDPVNFVDPSGLNASFGMCFTYQYGIEYKFEDGHIIRIPKGKFTICTGGGGGGFGSSSMTGGELGINLLPDKLPFDSCSEFVNWLVKTASANPLNILDQGNRAATLGVSLMDLALNGYERHIHNGYKGFKADLVAAGAGTEQGAQGAGVYGHVLGQAGAYLVGGISGNAIGTAASLYDRVQGFFGHAQSPSEIAGNAAGTAVGKHIWNLIRGDGDAAELTKSLTAELCKD